MNNNTDKTRWHRILAGMFKELLTPLNITVLSDVRIMTDPPKIDVLLIRRETPQWTDEQLMRLPDGIRDTLADHILIEFKFTEPVNRNALNQALAYDTFFRRTQKSLNPEQIQTFVLSSKTPLKAARGMFGYTENIKSGIYHSANIMLERLPLIAINELSDAPHNDFVKCFASRNNKRQQAFKRIIQSGRKHLSIAFFYFINGIMKLMNRKEQGGLSMETEITPDLVMEIGKEMYEAMLDGLRPEDFLERFDTEEILSKFKPEEVLSRYKPEERLSGLKPDEIEAYLRKIIKNNN